MGILMSKSRQDPTVGGKAALSPGCIQSHEDSARCLGCPVVPVEMLGSHLGMAGLEDPRGTGAALSFIHTSWIQVPNLHEG